VILPYCTLLDLSDSVSSLTGLANHPCVRVTLLSTLLFTHTPHPHLTPSTEHRTPDTSQPHPPLTRHGQGDAHHDSHETSSELGARRSSPSAGFDCPNDGSLEWSFSTSVAASPSRLSSLSPFSSPSPFPFPSLSSSPHSPTPKRTTLPLLHLNPLPPFISSFHDPMPTQSHSTHPITPSRSLTFTCTANDCGHRSTHEFAKRSYEKGIVLVQCPECKSR
jgi:hypothetical protein